MNNENQSSESKTKKITFGLVFSWLFGIGVGVPAIMMLSEKGETGAGIILLLVVLVVFPPTASLIAKHLHLTFSRGLKIFLILAGCTVAGIIVANHGTATTPLEQQNAQTIKATEQQLGAAVTPQPSAPAITTASAQPTTLMSLSGSGTKSTKTFTTTGDWTLDYSYDCSNFGNQGNFQVFVFNSSGSMSLENQGINQLGKSGSDTQYYHAAGSYYLEVNSECKWNIAVKG